MNPTTEPERALRILIVLHLPWDSKLGAARIYIELAKEWARAGHKVEVFCLTDAFPKEGGTRLTLALREIRFASKAAAYVRRNCGRFDVIDAVIGCLPQEKMELCFQGLLVARSVGLYTLYERFLRSVDVIWPEQPKGRWFGPLLHRCLAWWNRFASDKSVRHCDLLNVPNEDEKLALEQDPNARAGILVEPYGLTTEFRDALATAAAPTEERLSGKTICFIGMWSPRKGSLDWSKIIAAIRKKHPATKFLLLGTMFDEAMVRLNLGAEQGIIFHPTFDQDELPSLLAPAALALFPSYIEGFGLAVLEQLAAGLPVVAYDVAGPRQILHSQRERLLVPPGDVAALAARASEILDLTGESYKKLVDDCRAIARGYQWEEIARDTTRRYRCSLASLAQTAEKE
jgi:glycosyltransferase involved in cell wall biosynthesis